MYAQLARLLNHTLTVSDLAAGPVFSIPPNMRAADAAATLAIHRFDVAGVAEDPLSRYVVRVELERHRGFARGASHPILGSQCVESSLPLADVLDRLADAEFIFVLDRGRVSSIVSRADLSSLVVSTALLAHLAQIEQGLRRLLAPHIAGNVDDFIDGKRLSVLREDFERLAAQNIELTLLDCMYFSDWLRVLFQVPEVRQALAIGSSSRERRSLQGLSQLRNDLAHGRGLLHGRSAADALRLAKRVVGFSDTVGRSTDLLDGVWDRLAASVFRPIAWGRRPLTGAGARSWENAGSCLYVLSAWNLSDSPSDPRTNELATQRLAELIARSGGTARRVTTTPPGRRRPEVSLLIDGLDRHRVCELGRLVGQRAAFELTDQEVVVLRCSDTSEVRRTPRVSTSSTDE